VADDSSQINAWHDLRVGERVRGIGRLPRPDIFAIVELHSTGGLEPRSGETFAVIRDESDELHTVSVRQIVKV
jgi:hypothetical protein